MPTGDPTHMYYTYLVTEYNRNLPLTPGYWGAGPVVFARMQTFENLSRIAIETQGVEDVDGLYEAMFLKAIRSSS